MTETPPPTTPTRRRETVRSAIVHHTRAQQCVQRRQWHDAVVWFERAITCVTELEAQPGWRRERVLLLQKQREQMEAEMRSAVAWLEDDPFLALGVSCECSGAQVKHAFRRMALKYHPGALPGR